MVIRSWARRDTNWLRGALRAFLQAGIERGGDLLPTDRNVDALLNLGLLGAERGDPCLVADDPLVAFVLWTAPEGSHLVDMRWKTIQAIGSYTEIGERSFGVAGALREAARRMAVDLGYERITGPVHLTNGRGLREFCERGAWPTSVQMELLL